MTDKQCCEKCRFRLNTPLIPCQECKCHTTPTPGEAIKELLSDKETMLDVAKEAIKEQSTTPTDWRERFDPKTEALLEEMMWQIKKDMHNITGQYHPSFTDKVERHIRKLIHSLLEDNTRRYEDKILGLETIIKGQEEMLKAIKPN